MTTLGTMIDRIADELDRTDLSSQIDKAIKTAIKAYERQRFWFNEKRSLTFNTVDGQEFYTSSDHSDIPDLLIIDFVKLTVSGSDKIDLERASYQELEAVSDNATTDEGQPTQFAYYNKELRLYPIPDAAYAVRVSGVIALDDLSATGDSNAWMTDAEDLIRSRAKRELYTHVVKSLEDAGLMEKAEAQALSEMRSANTSRTATGTLVPTQF